MGRKLDGSKVASKIQDKILADVNALKKQGITPFLAVILVGNDSASKIYVARKEKLAQKLGIATKTYIYDETISEKELLEKIAKLNDDLKVHGILVQFPLPKHLNERTILESINSKKDVDGFHPLNVGYLVEGKPNLIPCTPYGIMKIFEEYNIDVEGKNCVVIGRSSIVGKPMSLLMLNHNATVTVCHSKTKNLANITKQADIIIVAVGKANFLTSEMVKEDVILIDVGMNRLESGLCGDIDISCYDKASYYTPVPGGVGPMTITMLMKQTVEIAKKEVKKCQ